MKPYTRREFLIAAPDKTFPRLQQAVPTAPFIEALGFPAVVVPTVNFDNNQHEENEDIRVGTLFASITTIAAILRMWLRWQGAGGSVPLDLGSSPRAHVP